MAHIPYLDPDSIDPDHQVADRDNIIQIHGVHSKVLRQHYDLYRELMYAQGPLTRVQREMIGVVVSACNACRY
jgi:hypothetical protein